MRDVKPDVASIRSGSTARADAPRKADTEKGNDTLLVEWYRPTDPDVSDPFAMLVPDPLTCICFVFSPGFAELVKYQESMGHVFCHSPSTSDLPFTLLGSHLSHPSSM
jgi:hypothetical protein